MRLAEALIEKKDLQVRIGDLQGRFTAAAVVEQGETADEETGDLLLSLEGAMERLEVLTVAVNHTNNHVKIGDQTLMQAIAHRDNLKMQISQYDAIISTIRNRNISRRHYGDSNVKMVLSEGISPALFIKKKDERAKELRLLDAAIQAANWQHDLV